MNEESEDFIDDFDHALSFYERDVFNHYEDSKRTRLLVSIILRWQKTFL